MTPSASGDTRRFVDLAHLREFFDEKNRPARCELLKYLISRSPSGILKRRVFRSNFRFTVLPSFARINCGTNATVQSFTL